MEFIVSSLSYATLLDLLQPGFTAGYQHAGTNVRIDVTGFRIHNKRKNVILTLEVRCLSKIWEPISSFQ